MIVISYIRISGSVIINNDIPSVGGSKETKTNIPKYAYRLFCFKKSTSKTCSRIRKVIMTGNSKIRPRRAEVEII